MKTVSVALVLCLNVGVDPPDVVKTQPCARLECWIGKSRIGISLVVLVQEGCYISTILIKDLGNLIQDNCITFQILCP